MQRWPAVSAYEVINAAVFAARGSVNGYPNHSAAKVRELLADRALSRLLKDDWPRTPEEMENLTKG